MRTYFLIAALALLPAATLLAAGCGESKHGDSGQDPAVAQAGAQVSTSGASSGAGLEAFNAVDLPITPGHEVVYDSNSPGTVASVSFDPIGPWKFASGPTDASLSVSLLATSQSPDSRQFADASVSSGTSWNSAAASEYTFQSRDSSTWFSYGRSFADGRPSVTYSARSRALVFPMTVGTNWVDTYTERDGGSISDVTAENRVIARNQLTVPAGTFDAWLLQTKVSSKSGGATTTVTDYSWFVPGIGRAAEIISKTDERNDVFSTARAFYRLKSYK
ncbi:MAG: hypothetical protein M1539_06625 [Actinobacteria bacterium]|nr:hypothetical protein [Actinomycetota bacterium]MCL5883629.1 hypothetical protein [Actinomycetota bacterium]